MARKRKKSMKAPPPTRMAVRRALTDCLRALRYAHNQISQEKLAAAAGIDRGYMSALERGRYSPTLEMLVKLVSALDITLVEFATEFERHLRRPRQNNNKE